MPEPVPASSRRPLTSVQWLICAIAAIGFAFDTYELLMLPLVVRPALMELGGIRPGTPEFTTWISLLFYVPAVAGGVFGLLGGYLTDRLGRRRVLTWSILLYAFGAFAAGFSTNLPMLLFFRCLVFVGVCVEFVAAVAWLAELFDDPRQRESVLGFTQAFSSIGGLLVATANGLAVAWAVNLPAIQLPGFLSFLGEVSNPHADWRYTLMSGLIPAIPLIIIRPFLPESPSWQRKREAGTLRRPSLAELFSPQLKRTTLLTTLMFTCSFAAAFGAIQQMPQVVPGLPDVKQQVLAARAEKGFDEAAETALKEKLTAVGKNDKEVAAAVAAKLRPIAGPIEQAATVKVTFAQEIGGLLGRVALAILVVFVVGRGRLLRLFLIPGLIVMPVVFGWAALTSLTYLEIGMFLVAFLTVGQFSFWGNYLPHVYPVHLRGTGESFSANIGGRLIGTCFAGITHYLATILPIDGSPATRIALAAAGVGFAVYLVNFVASFFLPEPKEGDLLE